jgi:hypothetical protein
MTVVFKFIKYLFIHREIKNYLIIYFNQLIFTMHSTHFTNVTGLKIIRVCGMGLYLKFKKTLN